MTFSAMAGVTNQLPGTKLGLKNAAYFLAKVPVTFLSVILQSSNYMHFVYLCLHNRMTPIILL